MEFVLDLGLYFSSWIQFYLYKKTSQSRQLQARNLAAGKLQQNKDLTK